MIYREAMDAASGRKRNKNMSVRAKFVVNQIERSQNGGYRENGQYDSSLKTEVSTIKLLPVSGGSEENKKFFAWTPTGEIQLGTINPEAAKQFELGKAYYVDFTPADVVEVAV